MSQARLPVIGSSQSRKTGKLQMMVSTAVIRKRSNSPPPFVPDKLIVSPFHSLLTAAKPSLPSPTVRQSDRRRSRNQTASSSSSSSRAHPGPSSNLLSDSSMAPWGGQVLYESSFTAIPLPPPAPAPPLPPTPPAPRPTPSTPYRCKQNGDRRVSGVACEASSSSGGTHQENAGDSIPATFLCCLAHIAGPSVLFTPSVTAGEAGRVPRSRRDLPHRQVAHLPRLRPLRPISNLSFSRSFTFSFFELPLHHSPRCRAERVRNLLLLWRQIHV